MSVTPFEWACHAITVMGRRGLFGFIQIQFYALIRYFYISDRIKTDVY